MCQNHINIMVGKSLETVLIETKIKANRQKFFLPTMINMSFPFTAFCGAGLYVSDPEKPNDCNLCPLGYYKAAPSYDPCVACDTDYTSNDERTACNVCKYQSNRIT